VAAAADKYAIGDALDDCKEAVSSMKQYLALADQQEIEVARKVLMNGEGGEGRNR